MKQSKDPSHRLMPYRHKKKKKKKKKAKKGFRQTTKEER